jgi:hypothetical protein
VFLELDIDQASATPEIPVYTRCVHWIAATYRRVAIQPNMGSKLCRTFRAAGLNTEIEMRGTTRLEGSGRTVGFSFTAETLRSLTPQIKQLGVAKEAEVGIDTLGARLEQTAALDNCIVLPRLVGAWARLPI